jgi:hypothetical protein
MCSKSEATQRNFFGVKKPAAGADFFGVLQSPRRSRGRPPEAEIFGPLLKSVAKVRPRSGKKIGGFREAAQRLGPKGQGIFLAFSEARRAEENFWCDFV